MNTERTCVTCPALRRDGHNDRPAPNHYDYQWACEECRAQLRGILTRIPLSHIKLDATPGTTRPEHVTGTMDAPLGVRIAVLDEILPAITNPTLPAGQDQEGVLPAARILWHIANAWLPARQDTYPWEHLPQRPTVKNLATWLTDRLEWALGALPALTPDHAAYLHALDHRLDRLNGGGTHRPTIIDGVACRECDRYSLTRQGDTITCTARGCRCRMNETEYERWTKLTAEHAKQDHHQRAA